MISSEFYVERPDGVRLFRIYSTINMMIEDSSENLYEEVIEPENSGETYTETNIPIPSYNVPSTGEIEAEEITITVNGTYNAPTDTAYDPVIVSVPSTTINSLTATENKTYTAPTGTAYNPVTVNVPSPPAIEVDSLSVTQNGTYTATSGHAYSPVTVSVPITLEENDVTFYDYDGTIVASYSKTDFANLSALPSNPTHSGLTSQGWNWTLSDAKTYVQTYGKLNIGQMCVTSDGKTRIYCHLIDGTLSPYLGLCPNGTVLIEWGDGADNVVTGSSTTTVKNTQHIYSTPGDYIITITPYQNTTVAFSGSSTYYSYLFRYSTSSGNPSKEGSIKYRDTIYKIELGNSIMIKDYAFAYLYNIESINIPSYLSDFGQYAFYNCYSLKNIVIPSGTTSFNSSLFAGARSMKSISIPSTLTTMAASVFMNTSSLKALYFPTSMTTASGNYCISSNYSLEDIILPSSTISGTNFLENCYNLSEFIIPSTTIPSYMCAQCHSMTSVTMSVYTTTINTYAFQACHSLISITIPSGVTSIGNYAFSYCYGLDAVHLKPNSPPSIGSSTFSNTMTSCVFYVPYSADHSILNSYKGASNWSKFATQMVEESQ